MLLPSLFGLHADGLLPADLTIVGTARTAMSEEAFRTAAATALERQVEPERRGDEAVASFLERLRYVAVDASEPEQFLGLAEAVGDAARTGLSIFLSTAPTLFGATIAGLNRAGPLGPNRAAGARKAARRRSRLQPRDQRCRRRRLPEQRTFRIDHYLGKETVQNLLALRFGNALFEPLWNASGIDHVQITVAETVGLEGRGGYFDGSGSLRDMVQNHMLQLLAPGRDGAARPVRRDRDPRREGQGPALAAPDRRRRAAQMSVVGQYGQGAVAASRCRL
jgi:glucose-6-phosphate 1-dehydrogenase